MIRPVMEVFLCKFGIAIFQMTAEELLLMISIAFPLDGFYQYKIKRSLACMKHIVLIC